MTFSLTSPCFGKVRPYSDRLNSKYTSLGNKRFLGGFCTKKPISVFCGRARNGRVENENTEEEKTVFSLSPHFARVQKYGNRLFITEKSTGTLASQATCILVSLVFCFLLPLCASSSKSFTIGLTSLVSTVSVALDDIVDK